MSPYTYLSLTTLMPQYTYLCKESTPKGHLTLSYLLSWLMLPEWAQNGPRWEIVICERVCGCLGTGVASELVN